jgi:hypothetical protein
VVSSSGFLVGCQLTGKPLQNSLIRARKSRRLCAEALTRRGSRLVRRSVEDVSIELEKYVGAGVT